MRSSHWKTESTLNPQSVTRWLKTQTVFSTWVHFQYVAQIVLTHSLMTSNTHLRKLWYQRYICHKHAQNIVIIHACYANIHICIRVSIDSLSMDGQDHIIESVDSISRDGPDTPINVIHYKLQQPSPAKIWSFSISYLWSRADFLSNKPKNIHKDSHKCQNQIGQRVASSFFFSRASSGLLRPLCLVLYESIQLYVSTICDTLISFRRQIFQKDCFGAFCC